MIELGILDLSAEGRRRLAALIERWSWTPLDARATPPKVSLTLLAPEEVRFHGSIDVCVVGPEIIGCDAAFVRSLRQQLPGKLIFCVLDAKTYSLGLVEQLGRLGVDDVLIDGASSDEFFRRLVLLQRRLQEKRRGRLVAVSSARGGVGVTFVAAAVSEAWLARKNRVCVVDCDITSQDLTRFLEVRPCVSEPLRLLLDQNRVATSEAVGECAVQVWSDEERFACVPPPAGGDDTLLGATRFSRAFIDVLETLVSQFDVVVVDSGGLPSTTLVALYQVCDEVIYVANRDPGGSIAHRQALLLVAGYARLDSRITTVINDNSVLAAAVQTLKTEALVMPDRAVREVVLPRSVKAASWPCSGGTPYQFLNRYIDDLVNNPHDGATRVDVRSRSPEASVVSRCFQLVAASFRRIRLRKSAGAGLESKSAFSLGREVVPGIGYTCAPLDENELVSRPVLVS
jgi:MinD-like ATPase involved in chromosome partitioning or flagellar assembly